MALDTTPGSASAPQVKYIRDLAGKKDLSSDQLNDEQRVFLISGNLEALSKEQASKAIGLLLKLDDLPAEEQKGGGKVNPAEYSDEILDERLMTLVDAPTVQAVGKQGPSISELESSLTEWEDKVEKGHYFIVDPTTNEERFFVVSKPDNGKWVGKTFLNVRASDTLYPVRDIARRIAIYEEISKDPINAMNEYGIRLGMCGKCGRTLTNKDSRLRGLGPICAAEIFSRPTDAQLELLSRLGLR